MTSSNADRGEPGRDFGARAALYAARRPGYPEETFERLLAALGGPRRFVVDLGAGAGQASTRLADLFDRVASVEPDARMLAAAPDHPKIKKINVAAEAASFPEGGVDAVTAATSFHWMDQAVVCALAARWLRPGGVFFPFLYGPFTVSGEAQSVFRRHRGLWGPYRDARLGSRTDYSIAIKASGLFQKIEYYESSVSWSFTPGEAAELFSTTSYASAYAAAHGGLDAYCMSLRDELATAAPVIEVTAPLGGVLAIKASD